jgi:hypothetical protein
MKKFFNYLFSLTFLQLFLLGFWLSIFLTGSFLYLAFEFPGVLIDEASIIESRTNLSHWPRFQDFTLLGIFYMFSGIIPNFILLILIFRIIKFIFIECLKLIGKILSIIFSDRNLDSFNKFVSKLEKTLIKHKPKVDKVLKKKIKKDYLMPISIVTAATILALAILFQ